MYRYIFVCMYMCKSKNINQYICLDMYIYIYIYYICIYYICILYTHVHIILLNYVWHIQYIHDKNWGSKSWPTSVRNPLVRSMENARVPVTCPKKTWILPHRNHKRRVLKPFSWCCLTIKIVGMSTPMFCYIPIVFEIYKTHSFCSLIVSSCSPRWSFFLHFRMFWWLIPSI